jgi:PAS domain S-box-containing protein
VSDASRDSVIVHAGDAIVEVNRAFCDQFGWSPEEALRLGPPDYIAPESLELVRERLASGTTDPFEVSGLHHTGGRRWYSAQSREGRFHGQPALVVVLTGITDLREREERALHGAHHDQLTGLPNRAAFEGRLEEEQTTATPPATRCCGWSRSASAASSARATRCSGWAATSS